MVKDASFAQYQKGHTKTQAVLPLVAGVALHRSLPEVAAEAAEHAENTLILHSDLPIPQVASHAVASLDAELRAELATILLAEHFIRLVRTARRKQLPVKQHPLPGFDHLPLKIRGRTKLKPIELATYEDMRLYVQRLGAAYRQTEKYKEAVRLRDRLKRRKHGVKAEDLF